MFIAGALDPAREMGRLPMVQDAPPPLAAPDPRPKLLPAEGGVELRKGREHRRRVPAAPPFQQIYCLK